MGIKPAFYLIVGVLLLLFCIGYVEFAIFIDNLGNSSEEEQTASFITNDINQLEEEFWKLRYWGKVIHTEQHPDAEKLFGKTVEHIKKDIAVLIRNISKSGFQER